LAYVTSKPGPKRFKKLLETRKTIFRKIAIPAFEGTGPAGRNPEGAWSRLQREEGEEKNLSSIAGRQRKQIQRNWANRYSASRGGRETNPAGLGAKRLLTLIEKTLAKGRSSLPWKWFLRRWWIARNKKNCRWARGHGLYRAEQNNATVSVRPRKLKISESLVRVYGVEKNAGVFSPGLTQKKGPRLKLILSAGNFSSGNARRKAYPHRPGEIGKVVPGGKHCSQGGSDKLNQVQFDKSSVGVRLHSRR